MCDLKLVTDERKLSSQIKSAFESLMNRVKSLFMLGKSEKVKLSVK